MKKYLLIALLCNNAIYAQTIDFDALYRSWGANPLKVDIKKAQTMWNQEIIANKSCASCHTNNLKKQGKHVKTKKIIKPLSTQVNPKRLTKVKKINKWLKRNCKFTYKRECSAQEKMDFIEFIKQS